MALTTESHRLRVQVGRGWRFLPEPGAREIGFARPFTTIRDGRAGCTQKPTESVIQSMSLKSLLLSSDEKTVRVLRRVLSDLEIDAEHCTSADEAIRRITRQRFEAIIADGANAED